MNNYFNIILNNLLTLLFEEILTFLTSLELFYIVWNFNEYHCLNNNNNRNKKYISGKKKDNINILGVWNKISSLFFFISNLSYGQFYISLVVQATFNSLEKNMRFKR